MNSTATAAVPTEKPCSHCREVLPLDAYNVNKHAKDGRHAICRECNKAKARVRRATVKAATAEVATKECSKCGQAKELDAFGTDRSRPDGKTSQCKDCRRARRTAV